jgi:mannose-6-phosphate isomerase-like protein (cupin superfamily)
MKLFHGNAKHLAKENDFFRNVLFTTPNSQLVVMSIATREDIGYEVHAVDQMFLIVKGDAEFEVEGESVFAGKYDVVIVPAGSTHNVRNVGGTPLKLVTVYSPPQHAEGTVHRTKDDALVAESPATI